MEFDPSRARGTAIDLDALADRLAADLERHAAALAVVAPGQDEVSRRAALTLTDVGTSFEASARGAVLELRKLAATLRMQNRDLTGMDADNAVQLTV